MSPESYVFFDMDDTLVEWQLDWTHAFREAAREGGVEVSSEQIWEALNGAFSGCYNEYLKKHAGMGEEREFWLDYNGQVMELLGVTGEVRGAAARATDLLKAPGAIRLFPEVRGVLESLKGKGVRLGIVTGRPRAEPDLEMLGVAGYFEVMLDALWAGEPKRVGGAVFRRAAEVAAEAGAVGWHVGDSYEGDVQAARAAGLKGVLVDRRGRYPEADCPRIADLSEFPAVLESG